MLVFESEVNEVMDEIKQLSKQALISLNSLHARKAVIDHRSNELKDLGVLCGIPVEIDITVEEILESRDLELRCKVTTSTGIVTGVSLGVATSGTVFWMALTSSFELGLTGAAAITHALASIAGGAISAGGGGMLGGLAILGGITAATAILVAGVLTIRNFQVNKQNLKKAFEHKAELKSIIARLNNADELLAGIERHLK